MLCRLERRKERNSRRVGFEREEKVGQGGAELIPSNTSATRVSLSKEGFEEWQRSGV